MTYENTKMNESTKTNNGQRYYKPDLLYPDLSYQIMGILFDAFTDLGFGYREQQYQKAFEIAASKCGLRISREVPVRITFKGKFLTTNYLDFLIEDKVVLEIKQGNLFLKKDIDQVFNYLKATELKLGILARFTKSGVRFKRVVNLYQ